MRHSQIRAITRYRETRGQNYLVKTLSLSFFLSGNEKHGINLVRYIRKLGRVTFIFVYDRDADFDADFTGTVFAEFVSFYLGETILYRNISFDSGGTNSGRWNTVAQETVARPETKSSYRAAADNFTEGNRIPPFDSLPPSFSPIVFVYVYLITRWIMMAKMKRKICN